MPGEAKLRPLNRLTALRAAAALWAFGYHFGYNLRWLDAARWFANGYASLAFFFILSGFVLTYSSRPTDTAWYFYRRRIARLYPSYVVAGVVAIILAPVAIHEGVIYFGMIQSWFAFSRSTDHILVRSLNPTGWSLSCEAFFYLIFPAMMVVAARTSTRAYAAGCIAWAAICVGGSLLMLHYGSAQAEFTTYFTPVFRSGEFLLGSGLCVAMRSGWRPRLRFLPAMVVMLAVAVWSNHHYTAAPRANLIMMPFFAAVVVAAAQADLDGTPGLLARRPFVYAGEISYTFYIIQYPILVYAHHHIAVPWHACVLAGIVTPISAVVLHHLVERPFQTLIAGRRRASKPPVATSQDHLVG